MAVLFDVPRELARDRGLVDELAVDLACEGRRVALTPAEQRVALVRLITAGMPAREIAGRLRVTERTVGRVRAELDADREPTGHAASGSAVA